MHLHNRFDSKELKAAMLKSNEPRITISFYKYVDIGNPYILRDHLYIEWNELGVLGRVYLSYEGINAQISIPKDNLENFNESLNKVSFLEEIRLNIAIDDNGKSFFKLKMKVRRKIVADGLNDETFDVTNKGIHLDAKSFNEITDLPNTLVVDMRNHYETEVGHFKNAICPDVDTFRQALPVVEEMLQEHRDKNIVMYCTGGIRCEKASAYFKHKGFKNVFQLEGGIINYARQAAEKGLENKFIGKNFVFDERLGERISDDVIAHCHQCGKPCDDHTNCANEACNLLFIQCEECKSAYNNCCSEECKEIILLPEEEQLKLRKGKDKATRIFTKGRFKLKTT